MATEDVSDRYLDLDAWESGEVLQALWEGQLAAVAAIGPALPAIAAAAEAAEAALRRGGRLIYVGAGTSGRIGVQDGAELPPTFDWPEERLAFAIAGGKAAILKAVENAEDSTLEAARWVTQAEVGPDDVVVGLAASGTTPFTLAVLKHARAQGAVTVGIANNPGTPILEAGAFPVLIATGAEVVAGSTRMKAGTAQKIVLNLFSTLVMIRLGRVYRGQMVAMRATNAKLRARMTAMVARLADCNADTAERAAAEADGDIKRAVLIAAGATRTAADAALTQADGNLRHALESMDLPAGEHR